MRSGATLRRRLITGGVAAATLLGGVVGLTATAAGGTEGAPSTYIVLASGASTSQAAAAVRSARGTVVAAYDQIGVVLATSSDAAFGSAVRRAPGVVGAAATGTFGVRLADDMTVLDPTGPAAPAVPAGGDPLSNTQWDMGNIGVWDAHAVTMGSPDVVVGDIDTGLDYTHPDLAANVDFSRSVSCVGGVPNTDPAAWMDDNGHGTHTAGTIAAAKNGIGIVGVAPGVRIAGIKAGNADGFFFPEAVVCAFMWAGSHGIAVTNNSYYADPWQFNCRNDVDQRAIWEAERRAIRWAMQQRVSVVAAQGNANMDLSKTNIDTTSPDNGTPVTREVTNACAEVPNEVPGVIGVNATGASHQKAYYSSYGVGVSDLSAPGGDRRYQDPGDGSRGYVLSTYPGNRYALAQGTSMAAPHVTGVAALALSEHGLMSPGALAALLEGTATPYACPVNPFDPGGTGASIAYCAGGIGYNGFYGHGEVNALAAVTR